MNIRLKKTWLATSVVALAMTTAGGVAIAAGQGASPGSGLYTGDSASTPDPDNTGVPLKLYNAAGTEITSGTTSQPLGAFAAADGTVRANDDYATLFVHLTQSTTAPGDWPGVQATGTDKFTGAGAVTAPGSLAGKPYVRTTNGSYTLADVVAALPSTDTGATFTGVYELRLRTSAVSGVANQYAVGYVKVTGNSWTKTTAPDLGNGGVPGTTLVATSTTATWPASLTYGKPGSASVTVAPASGAAKPTGTVRLVSGSTTLATATLSSAGTATLAIPGNLAPGSKSLKVTYAGVTNTWGTSESAGRTITVAKAATGAPTYKTVKAPTSKKKGSATVTVPVPAGLSAASGTASLVLKKGSASKTIAVTITNGKATVKLPKLTPGKWTVTVSYAGSTFYLSSTSKSYKLKVKKAK